MGISGARWYIHYGGCDGWWRKMVLIVLQVWSGVISVCFFCRSREMLDGLCVWVKVWEKMLVFMSAFGKNSVVAGVMVGEGKWYLWCFRYGVVSWVFFFCRSREVLDGLCVWVKVWEKMLVFMSAFGKNFWFFV